MTKQEVVNEILIHRAPDLTLYHTREQLARMWEILVGEKWSRKSATKRDIAYALYLHVYRMIEQQRSSRSVTFGSTR